MTGEHTSVIYGTHYPYRLFVGCLPSEAGAEDLGTFFSKYGNVVEAKVVLDDKGRSKRFGFVTFSNKDDVAELIKKRAIKFQEKMINVGPAVKKNLENENHNCRPTTTIPTTTATTKTSPPPLTQTKQSIYRGPQHVPKTIIRKSPTEMAPILNGNYRENTFSNMWGISSRKNSVWSSGQTQIQTAPLTSQNDVSYSSLSSNTSLNSSSHESWWPNYSMQLDNTSWNQIGLGSITPPPGLYQADFYRK
jgi:RNA recognition motif-containing protein